MTAVAAFDFDRTLTDRDSLLPFLALVGSWPSVGISLGRSAPSLRHGRDSLKTSVLARTVGGLPISELRRAGDRYAQMLVANRLRATMLERVEWHRSQGHEIVIVSASLDVYLKPVSTLLGIDNLYCSTLIADDRGLATGELDGGNCRGPRKAELLRAHIGDRSDAELWAYGDSAGDEAMLAAADHAFRVERRGRLCPVRSGGAGRSR